MSQVWQQNQHGDISKILKIICYSGKISHIYYLHQNHCRCLQRPLLLVLDLKRPQSPRAPSHCCIQDIGICKGSFWLATKQDFCHPQVPQSDEFSQATHVFLGESYCETPPLSEAVGTGKRGHSDGTRSMNQNHQVLVDSIDDHYAAVSKSQRTSCLNSVPAWLSRVALPCVVIFEYASINKDPSLYQVRNFVLQHLQITEMINLLSLLEFHPTANQTYIFEAHCS